MYNRFARNITNSSTVYALTLWMFQSETDVTENSHAVNDIIIEEDLNRG